MPPYTSYQKQTSQFGGDFSGQKKSEITSTKDTLTTKYIPTTNKSPKINQVTSKKGEQISTTIKTPTTLDKVTETKVDIPINSNRADNIDSVTSKKREEISTSIKTPTMLNNVTETKIDIPVTTIEEPKEDTIATQQTPVKVASTKTAKTENPQKTDKFSGSLFDQKKQVKTNPSIETQKPKIDSPAVSSFSIENQTLRTELAPYLRGVSFEKMVKTVNNIKDAEVRTNIQDLLSSGLITNAQEYIGMSSTSEYTDPYDPSYNLATGYIDSQTIDRLASPHLLRKGAELMPYLSGDIKQIYSDFLSNKLSNNGKPYAIISKDDYTIYIFNYEHRLIDQQNVLLGKSFGDNIPILRQGGSVFTTPGGLYTINNISYRTDEFAGQGHYLQLQPKSREYPADFSIGIHEYFYRSGDRKSLLESYSKEGKRVSNGCANTLPRGTIYDNIVIGSVAYIAYE